MLKFCVMQFNDIINVIFSSSAMVGAMIAYLLDWSHCYWDDSVRKDRGLHWFYKYRSYNADARSEEFYALPYSLGRYFPSYQLHIVFAIIYRKWEQCHIFCLFFFFSSMFFFCSAKKWEFNQPKYPIILYHLCTQRNILHNEILICCRRKSLIERYIFITQVSRYIYRK